MPEESLLNSVNNLSTKIALVEERLSREIETISGILKALRGDGNGEAGLFNRFSSLKSVLERVLEKQEEMEEYMRELKHDIRSSQNSSRVKWKIVLSVVGQISAVVGSLSAIIIALYGHK